MTNTEAHWIANVISKYESEFFPLLNLGSSTGKFRKTIQPYIDEIIFAPLAAKNHKITHSDIKLDEGVDIAGDIFDADFAQQLTKLHYRSVICSNVLEHIENPSKFCYILESIMPAGAYLIITVPNIYPFHKDPIDTKFRPDVKDIADLFSNCKVIEGIIQQTGKTHFAMLIKNPYKLLLTVKNWLIPRFGFKEWKLRLQDIPNLFKKYRTTFVLLQKI